MTFFHFRKPRSAVRRVYETLTKSFSMSLNYLSWDSLHKALYLNYYKIGGSLQCRYMFKDIQPFPSFLRIIGHYYLKSGILQERTKLDKRVPITTQLKFCLLFMCTTHMIHIARGSSNGTTAIAIFLTSFCYRYS